MTTLEKNKTTKITPAEEAAIVRDAQIDPAAFRPLYEIHFRTIYLFVLSRVRDKEFAADLTQQVFVKALTGIGKFKFQGFPFSSWLYRIAINECYGFFRKNNRVRFVTIEEISIEYLYEELTAETTQDQLLEKMPLILQQLSPEDLTLIELRFFEKRSFREVAEIVGLTEVNAKVRTYRILQKMKLLFLS